MLNHSEADSEPASVNDCQPTSNHPQLNLAHAHTVPLLLHATLRVLTAVQVIAALVSQAERPHRHVKIGSFKQQPVELVQCSEADIAQTLHREVIRTQRSAFHVSRLVHPVVAQKCAERTALAGRRVSHRNRALRGDETEGVAGPDDLVKNHAGGLEIDESRGNDIQSDQLLENQVRGCLFLISCIAIWIGFDLDLRCRCSLPERLRTEVHAVDILLKEFRILVFEIDHFLLVVALDSEHCGQDSGAAGDHACVLGAASGF